MSVCQTCGSIGFADALVPCSKCEIITEHAYCLDKSVTTEEGEIIWTCEFCEPRIIDLSDLSDNLSDRTEELVLTDESQREMKSCDSGPSTNEVEVLYIHSENSHRPAKHMHDFVEDLHLLSEASEDKRAKAVYAISPEAFPTRKDEYRSTIKPLPDPIWMGNFHIYGEHSGTVPGMMAHLSNEAIEEAAKVASMLPVVLHLEMVPKLHIWPIKFKDVGPSVDNIAVYFFPKDERAERVYDCLVDDIIEHRFVMSSRFNGVELLIFSSFELPIDNRRIHRKYYLWGLFRRKRRNLPQNRSVDCTPH